MAEHHRGKHYLREWRDYRGLSLRKLADRLESEPGVPLMSHANIGRIENNVQPYDQDYLEAVAVALDCSVTDLLSIDPFKDGEVIDLVRLIKAKDAGLIRHLKNKDPDLIVRVLMAL